MASDDDQGFETPEEAALSGWNPESNAHVLRVEVENDNSVYVLVDTEPSQPMRVHCERIEGRWQWTSDTSA